MISKIILLLLLLIPAAHAANVVDGVFRADAWDPGIHMMGGIGTNASMYTSNQEKQTQGIGANFLTNFGYYLNDHFAFELGSIVKFNYVGNVYIWDTLLTTGVRYRFDRFPFSKSKAIYARAFVGRAPTVAFTDRAPSVVSRTNASRIQYDGPVVGLALGNMYDNKDGKVWFVEYGLSIQSLDKVRGIDNDGEVPVTVFNKKNTDKTRIYSAYFSIGLLVF